MRKTNQAAETRYYMAIDIPLLFINFWDIPLSVLS